MTTTYKPIATLNPPASLGDNLEQRFARNFAESNRIIGQSVGARTLRTNSVVAVDFGGPAGYFNSAVLTEPPTPETLDLIDGFFGRATSPVSIYSPWPLFGRLGAEWELEGHPPFMVRSPRLGVPARRTSLEIVKVAGPVALRHWEQVAIAGFPFPDAVAGTLVGPEVLRDERLQMWVGYDGSDPVAIGTSFAAYGVVSFMLGVTIPSARGRGYWTDMAATRIASDPAGTFVSINSDSSQPGALKLGFLAATRWHAWKKRP